MAFLQTQRARFGPLLFGWGPIGVMLAVVARGNGWTWAESLALTAVLCIVGAPLFASARFVAMAFPLRQENSAARWATWCVDSTAMGGLWSGSAWLAGRVLAPLPGLGALPSRVQLALPVLAGFGTLLFLGHLGIYYLVQAQRQTQEAEAQQTELRRLALDAELKALRAQINPHFLFNSLNSISALTTIDPARAREMCVLLSDFLRKSLGLGERQSVSLKEELELLHTYLAIETTRFGERLQVEWSISPAAESLQLPPLLLQPLVENAIKPGISALPEGGTLHISAFDGPEETLVQVENPCDPEAEAPKGLGLGLGQLLAQLRGRFGPARRFEAQTVDCIHRVTLTIPNEAE